jgi:hypothetical protein
MQCFPVKSLVHKVLGGWRCLCVHTVPNLQEEVVFDLVEHSENNEPLDLEGLRALSEIVHRLPHEWMQVEGVHMDIIDLLNFTLGSSSHTEAEILAITRACAQTMFNANPDLFCASYGHRLGQHADGLEAYEWADQFWQYMEFPLPKPWPPYHRHA